MYACRMGKPARRGSGRPSRRQREARAYRLTLATGAVSLAAVVVLVLSIAGAASFGLFLLLAVIAAALGFVLKRSLGA
jgi:hypothetical protein